MKMQRKLDRRSFFQTGALAGVSLTVGPAMMPSAFNSEESLVDQTPDSKTITSPKLPSKYALNLEPAKWIWYPSQRTLPNTFVLFRKEITLNYPLKQATGWILGDSRYLLEVNGQRVQWGPAPADPRYAEADPVDLTQLLKLGDNVIGITVLYYGLGDGTWPAGKPGLIFLLDLEFHNGQKQQIISDDQWHTALARCWRPGQYKRWYLRALQEEFDARLYPYGWSNPGFETDSSWIAPLILSGGADKPALNTDSSDYLNNSSGGGELTELRKRSVPMLLEHDVPVATLVESFSVSWHRPVTEYFEMVTPNAYSVNGSVEVELSASGDWVFELNEPGSGVVLLFEFKEQVVGWPYFSVSAPEGTTFELLVQEGHVPFKNGGEAIMNNHFNSWTRFTCKAGKNEFQEFDFESVKWLQLHVHNGEGEIRISKVGINRRCYNWPNPPVIRTSHQGLQKLANASLNTIFNNAQEVIADGMGRERQQYSGDIGHELHALYSVFGEYQLPARYLNTFSQGMTKDGFFLDTWPAYDRLNRLAQRQLDLTPWGPLLDHGIQFNFDCYFHYLYSGRREDLEEVFPRLVRFSEYLGAIVAENGLLPVEDLGIPTVWMDTDAYQQQRHKQCAFNLYAAAMLRHIFPKLCRAFEAPEVEEKAISLAQSILTNTIKYFWDRSSAIFVCNLPWQDEDGGPRFCERSLSLAILYQLCPEGKVDNSISTLEKLPDNLGRLYPANGIWTLWALARAERMDAVFHDFETRWLKMDSVYKNNTMQEAWKAIPDSNSQWSHASIGPLISVYMDIAGIRPTTPGFKTFMVKPQMGPVEQLELINYSPQGPINFKMEGKLGKRRLEISVPPNSQGLLVVDQAESIKLPLESTYQELNKKAYKLSGGQSYKVTLKYT